MLTKSDLLKIKTVIKDEIDPLKSQVTQVDKRVNQMDKRLKKVEKYTKDTFDFLDRQDIDHEKRIKRMETHLSLSPLVA